KKLNYKIYLNIMNFPDAASITAFPASNLYALIHSLVFYSGRHGGWPEKEQPPTRGRERLSNSGGGPPLEGRLRKFAVGRTNLTVRLAGIHLKDMDLESVKDIKVRRASERTAIEVCKIKGLLDISGIQVYSINGKEILHLDPEKKKEHYRDPNCKACKRKLMDSKYCFCSIACKYYHLLDDPQTIETSADEIYFRNNSSETTIEARADEIYLINNNSETMTEARSDEIYLRNNTVISEARSMRKRSRKRIPTRAPF
ncbi:PLATZ transcription factor family protein, partial [Striga asiatica]